MVCRQTSFVFLMALALANPARPQAPAGYRTHADADSGLEYYAPIAFGELRRPPTESVTKATYTRKAVPDACKDEKGALKPQFEVFVLPRVSEGTPPKTATPKSEKPAPESRPESAPESAPANTAK